MTDVVDAKTRSRMMSGIRGRDTTPELIIRRALFQAGSRYRLHRKDLPGAPDIVLLGRKVAIFVHGCFWHQHAGCKYAKQPATRREFWMNKLECNVERDRQATGALLNAGWRVLTVWECSTRGQENARCVGPRVVEWINSQEPSGEISRIAAPEVETR